MGHLTDKFIDDFNTEDVNVHRQDTVYDGFCKMQCLHLQHKLFSGGWSDTLSRECLLRPAAVSVLAYDPVLDKVVLVKQFRVGAYLRSTASKSLDSKRQTSWIIECVAGLMDKDTEDPAETARRELQEESGLQAKKLDLIHDVYVSPGASNERALMYYAEVDASQAGSFCGLKEEHEDIAVVVLSWEEFLDAKSQGNIDNAQCMLAFYWLQQNRDKLRFNSKK